MSKTKSSACGRKASRDVATETMPKQDMSAILPPLGVLMSGYACQVCRVVQFPRLLPGTADEMAECRDKAARCCAPRACTQCGKAAAPSRTWCRSCMAEKERAKWRALPVAESGETPDGYIVAFIDRYFHGLEDYLETCFLDEREPADGLPEWCKYEDAPMPVPDLAEHLFQEMDDFDTPTWCEELQAHVEKVVAANRHQWIVPNGTRPKMPTLAEMQAETNRESQPAGSEAQ